MGKILTPWGQNKPPLGSQLDWSHPLSQGLVGCWLMNEGGGNVVNDIANQNNGVFFGGVNYLLSGIKISTGRIDCTDKGKINPVNGIYSVVFNCSFINIVSPYGGIYVKTTNGVDNSFALGRDEGNDSLKVYHSNVEGLVLTNLKPSSLVQKGYQTVAITNYGYNISAYLNGSLKDTGVISLNSLPGVGNGILRISSERGGTLNYATDGLWKYFYIYNRALSPQEIQSLYIAPYQMIRPKRIVFGYTAAEPPVTTSETAYGFLSLNTGYW